MKNTKLITIVLAMLMVISSLTILADIQTASASNFATKAAQVNLCNILPGHSSYVPNWLSLLQGMGVNTLRIGDGGEGKGGYNIATNANWAQTLESILTTITGIDRNGAGTSTGINKVYWQSMGDDIGGAFGIPDYGATVGLLNINTAKSYIDKLAGNNVYGHNFISDSRILSWNIGNEQQIGDGNGNLNSQYYWIIQLMDYIRSKGGHVACNAPYVGNWNGNPSIIAPLFYGHADYYEIHYYGNWELGTPAAQGGYYLGNGQVNWAGWSTMVKNKLTSDVAAASPWYDSNHILLGEFGVAFPTIFNHPEISVTPQMQADYFTYYFQALNAMGSIKWTCPFEAFMGNGHYYGVISGGTRYDTYSKGTPYPAYYVIATNYAGYSNPTPTQSPTPTPTQPPAPTPSGSSSTFGTTSVGGMSTTFYTGTPRAVQYTPTSSGTVTDLMLYLTGSGHAQVAIYANSGGKPGALLAKSSSDTINSNGWHDFQGFNVAITAGTSYWLAFESDSSNLLFYYNNGGANYCQGTGYTNSYGTFPNPYTTLYTGSYSPSIYAIYH